MCSLVMLACSRGDSIPPPTTADGLESSTDGHLERSADTMCVAPEAGCAFPDDVPATLDAQSVLGRPLATCSTEPLTGFRRSGRCETGPADRGVHVVCARMTDAFLNYTRDRGNDLITPRPEFRFPGLRAGDGWCLCAARWLEALEAGMAPPVVLEATDTAVLDYTTLATLRAHAVN